MSRAVAGLRCRIRVPVGQYQAVALLAAERGHVIRLMHKDAGLSLDIEAFDNLATAEGYRDRLAGFLGLPPVIIAGEPSPREKHRDEPRKRRVRGLRARRVRFLTRRNKGAPITIQKIEGREIIARN